MAYDAKPTLDDVILNTWQERDRLHVALYLRNGVDGQGDLVAEWWDADCEQMFEDGFLKRSGRPGKLSDNDVDLARSALDYAVKHKLGAIAGFETSMLDAVTKSEGMIENLYTEAHMAPYHEVDPIEFAIEESIVRSEFPQISRLRLENIKEYLVEYLEDRVLPSSTI